MSESSSPNPFLTFTRGLWADPDHYAEAAVNSCRHLCALMDAAGATATRVVSGELTYVAGIGIAEGLMGRRTSLTNSFTGRVVAAREARVFRLNGELLDETRQRAVKDEIRSGIVAPVVVDDEVVGTLGVASTNPDRFSGDDLATTQQVADFLAKELKRRTTRQKLESDMDWKRLERFGANLEAAHAVDLLRGARGLSKHVEIPEVAKALEAINAYCGELLGRRRGSEIDAAKSATRRRTASMLSIPRFGGGEDVTTTLAPVMQNVVDAIRGEIEELAELSLGPLPSVVLSGAEETLRTLLVHATFATLDRIPIGQAMTNRVTISAASDERKAVIQIGATVPNGTGKRDDGMADPFASDGLGGGVSEAMARRAARSLNGTFELIESETSIVARIQLPTPK